MKSSDKKSQTSANEQARMQYVYTLLAAVGGVVLITLVIAGVVPYIKRKHQESRVKRKYTGIQDYPNIAFEEDEEA